MSTAIEEVVRLRRRMEMLELENRELKRLLKPLDGISIRPLRNGDTETVAAVFERLSDESRRRRFGGPKPRLSAMNTTDGAVRSNRACCARSIALVNPLSMLASIASAAACSGSSSTCRCWGGKPALAASIADDFSAHARDAAPADTCSSMSPHQCALA